MTTGPDALTEREKATLRLLLDGHDAKSIARHLGLSVHTIHERLREARRKLGTSSSREAARMLREFEGTPPKSVGDKEIGDADRQQDGPVPRPQALSGGDWRRRGWIAGGLAMTVTLALLALAALGGPGDAPAPAPRAPLIAEQAADLPAAARSPQSEAAAVEAAEQFLARLDRDDWAGSWQATHRSFQLLNTVGWWTEASQQVRGRFGAPLSRELATVDLRAVPPDGYWIVTFKARYDRQASVTERVELASEDGHWKVAAISLE